MRTFGCPGGTADICDNVSKCISFSKALCISLAIYPHCVCFILGRPRPKVTIIGRAYRLQYEKDTFVTKMIGI